MLEMGGDPLAFDNSGDTVAFDTSGDTLALDLGVGTASDFVARIQALLPPWFPNLSNASLVVTALIAGYATMASFIYSLLAYVSQQTRIKTASDGWLDLIAYDFFGGAVMRNGQTDAAFAQTIIASIFAAKNTRAAIIGVLQSLTGNTAVVWVPGSADPNAYLKSTAYYGVTQYGCRVLPFTVFVTIQRGFESNDAQIYAAVNSVISAGITAWVQIHN